MLKIKNNDIADIFSTSALNIVSVSMFPFASCVMIFIIAAFSGDCGGLLHFKQFPSTSLLWQSSQALYTCVLSG